jgi:hypothetical protein
MGKALKIVSGINRLGSNPKKLISQLGRRSILAGGALKAPGILRDFDLPGIGHGRAPASIGLKSSLFIAGDGPSPNPTRAFLQIETCTLLVIAVFLSDAYSRWIQKDNRASTTSTCPKNDYAVTQTYSSQALVSALLLFLPTSSYCAGLDDHPYPSYGWCFIGGDPRKEKVWGCWTFRDRTSKYISKIAIYWFLMVKDTTTTTPPKPVTPGPSSTRKHNASRIFEASMLSFDASFA